MFLLINVAESPTSAHSSTFKYFAKQFRLRGAVGDTMAYRGDALEFKYSPKEFLFEIGVQFRGLTISENGEGYNIIIRAYLRNNAPVYAMVNHEDPYEGLHTLMEVLAQKNGAGMWRSDKFFKRA